MTPAGPGKARAAIAVYVALAVHALLALGLALGPATQDSVGAGVGLSVAGAGLEEMDRRLALAPPDAPLASLANPATPPTAESEHAPSASERAFEPRTRAVVEPRGGGGIDSYFARLRAHLTRHRAALPPRWVGARAQVRVELGADGVLRAASIEQGSGNVEFDAAALELVRRASPFPAPPQRRAMRLVIPIELDPA